MEELDAALVADRVLNAASGSADARAGSKNQKDTSMEMECKRVTSEHRGLPRQPDRLIAALAK